jgi:hypothetical protein
MRILDKFFATVQLRRSERSVILMPAAASRPVATFRQTAEKHRQTVEPFYQATEPFRQTAGRPGQLAEWLCQTAFSAKITPFPCS